MTTNCDEAFAPGAPTWICPECGENAYLCGKSDHGAVNGPALHCKRFPHHNAFDPAEFGRWRPGEQRG